MQMLKSFLFVGAAVMILSPVVSLADTEAQIKARAAMEQKLKELETQAPAAQPTPARPAPEPVRAQPAQPTQPAQPAPGAPPPAVTRPPALPPSMVAPPDASAPAFSPPSRPVPTQPAPAPAAPATTASAASEAVPVLDAPVPSSPEAIEKAREALRQRMAELPPATVDEPVVKKPSEPVVREPAAEEPTRSVRTSRSGRRVFQDDAAADKPAAQPEPEVANKPPVQEVAKPSPAPARPKQAPVAKTRGPEFAPMVGPPTGLSASKEQRLQELLQAYREDRIRPDEYHAQRAKILSEP